MVKVASECRGKGGVTGNETSERVKYLVQICLVVRLHNFQLVLPRVGHSRLFGLIKQTAI